MRRLLVVLLLGSALLTACTALVDLENQVVAQVGDEKIRLRDVIDRIGRLSPQSRQGAATQEGREKILEDLINEEVLLREAARVGVEVTDEEVEAEYLAERKQASEANPTSVIQGTLPVLRERDEIRRLLLMQKVTAPHLGPDKISERYEVLRTNGPPRYAAQYEFLWVGIGDTTFPREIEDEIKKGTSLQALARQHSSHPLFINGGVSHVALVEELEPWLRAALVDAKPGQVLEPHLTNETGKQTVMFVKVLYKWNFPPIEAIQNELIRILYAEYLGDLKSKIEITRYPERLALIERQ